MGFTYTDRNYKSVIEAWGTFMAVATEAVYPGDLLNMANSSTTRTVQLADQSANKPARAVALQKGDAGQNIKCGCGAILKSYATSDIHGSISDVSFSADGDYYGGNLFLGEDGKPSSTAGTTLYQSVGVLIDSFTILLQPRLTMVPAMPQYTALVIASDAPSSLLAWARYVKPFLGEFVQICDGSGDQTEIAAAVTASRIVQLSQGTFYCSSFIDPGDYTWLRGMGIGATTLDWTLKQNIGIHAGADSIAARTQFAITDMTLDGHSGGLDVNNDTDLIQLTDCTRYRIENVATQGAWACGLAIAGTSTNDVTVNNYYATGHSRGGIEISAGAHMRFSNIRCIDNDVSTYGPDINMEAGSRSITDVQFNQIYVKQSNTTSNRACVSVNGDTQNVKDVVISNFLIEGGVYGFLATGAGRTKLSHGIIKGSTNGLTLSTSRACVDFTARDVDILDCETRGLWLGGPVAKAANNLSFSQININGTAVTYSGAMTSGFIVDGTLNNITNAYLSDSEIHDCGTNITDADAKVIRQLVRSW